VEPYKNKIVDFHDIEEDPYECFNEIKEEILPYKF
jgi:hypothetical protein